MPSSEASSFTYKRRAMVVEVQEARPPFVFVQMDHEQRACLGLVAMVGYEEGLLFHGCPACTGKAPIVDRVPQRGLCFFEAVK